MTPSSDTALLDTLVRMVTPMRREFGWTIDVQQARRDVAYARRLIEQAMTSRVPRLRDYAQFVDSQLQGEPASPATPTAPARAVPHDARAMATLASRGLIDLVGPLGEPLAMKLEAARDAATLSALVRQAHDCVAAVRGAAAAQSYLQRLRSWQPEVAAP